MATLNITQVYDLFNKADFEAYVAQYALPTEFAYKTFFPGLYQPTLEFSALEVTAGLKVAGDVVAFNSRSPRKGRQIPNVAKGSIPKIDIALPKEESEINRYNHLRYLASQASNTQAADRIVEFMYGDAAKVLDGVNARLEWLAKRIASTGKAQLTLGNNSGGYTTLVVDFGIPSGSITSVGTDWDTTASATPVADIRAKVTAGRTAGVIYRYMITDQATIDRIAATADMQKFAASYVVNSLNLQRTPDVITMNTALRNAGLPQFILWDSYMNLEAKDGTQTPTTGWQDGNILFATSNVLGNTQNTTVADETVNDGTQKTKNDFVLVKTWYEQDPLVQVTQGKAYAIPVLNGADKLAILQTQL